jgi:hypothetical protein
MRTWIAWAALALAGARGAARAEVPIVDDARTEVRARGDRFRVVMFYAGGGRFAEGEFREGDPAHPVFWRPRGWGTVHHPDGRRWARERAGGGAARYWLSDGRLFAATRARRVVALGRAVHGHAEFRPCASGRLYAEGPSWTGASSAKHFRGLTRLFSLFCGDPAEDSRPLHSRWYPDGSPALLRGADGALICFAPDGADLDCDALPDAVDIINRRRR